MEINSETVSAKILAYLNSELAEQPFIDWAEDTLVTLSESDDDIPDEDTLMDILGYIGAGDVAGFPLTWDVLRGFLERLGMKVRVMAQRAG